MKPASIAGRPGVLLAALCFLKPSPAEAERREAGKSPTAEQLPIAQVVLFSRGVGYFQREGTIDGDQRIDLSFPTEDINDLIKSMTLRDMDGGHVTAVTYDSNAPIERTLESFAVNLSNPTGGATLGAPASAQVTILDNENGIRSDGFESGSFVGWSAKYPP